MVGAWSAAMAVNFAGGSSYYFLSVGTWVAIIVLARALLLRLDEGLRFYQLASVALVVIASGQPANRRELSSDEGKGRGTRQSFRRRHTVFYLLQPRDGAEDARDSGLQARRQSSASLPSASQMSWSSVPPSNQTVLVVSPDYAGKVFVIPATTGIPMIDGVPPWDLNSPYYGFSLYGPDLVNEEKSDAIPCQGETAWLSPGRHLGSSREAPPPRMPVKDQGAGSLPGRTSDAFFSALIRIPRGDDLATRNGLP